MHRHTDGYQAVADVHGVSRDAVHSAPNQASGVDLPVFAAAMDVFKTDCDEPDSLAEQGHGHTSGDKNSIHNQAVEHNLGAESQGPGGEYEREKGVSVAEKEIADGDVPGVQSSPVLLRFVPKF